MNRNRGNARLPHVTGEQFTQGPGLWRCLIYSIKDEEWEYIRLDKIIIAESDKKISNLSTRLCVSSIAGYKLHAAEKVAIENRGTRQIYINAQKRTY